MGKVFNKKRKLSNRRGFTLTEMLIVVIVIGVLVAMGMFHLLRSVDDARDVAVKQNLETLFTAANAYYAQKGAVPATCQKLVEENFLTACPTGPDSGGTYTFSTLSDGNIEITYSSTGNSDIKLSELYKAATTTTNP